MNACKRTGVTPRQMNDARQFVKLSFKRARLDIQLSSLFPGYYTTDTLNESLLSTTGEGNLVIDSV